MKTPYAAIVVALTQQATMTFHHTIEERNETDKKKKAQPN